ncbi:MAG TPA: hypothetical protein PLW65_24055 [Pseudomonadota bacterium]|nr:hypothetical protein [Pseudomonadota bacterium]
MLRQLKSDVQTKMIRVMSMTISTQQAELAASRRGIGRSVQEAAPRERIGTVMRQLADCWRLWPWASKAPPWGG